MYTKKPTLLSLHCQEIGLIKVELHPFTLAWSFMMWFFWCQVRVHLARLCPYERCTGSLQDLLPQTRQGVYFFHYKRKRPCSKYIHNPQLCATFPDEMTLAMPSLIGRTLSSRLIIVGINFLRASLNDHRIPLLWQFLM